ncbi:MAG: N-acetylmuramoyl-L-alanine amidase [Pseudomonadota bacterium]
MQSAPAPNQVEKIHRIVMHWTAGSHDVSEFDIEHYHEIVSGDGIRVLGKHRPEDNLDLTQQSFAGHTKDLNAGSVGLSMACMREAVEMPFDNGSSPMTERQLDVFCKMVAEYCVRYGLPVTQETVLSHAEVEPTLRVRQTGKWDITVLPGMTYVGDPVAVGNILRDRIRMELRTLQSG